jgi:hypothetical protein
LDMKKGFLDLICMFVGKRAKVCIDLNCKAVNNKRKYENMIKTMSYSQV